MKNFFANKFVIPVLTVLIIYTSCNKDINCIRIHTDVNGDFLRSCNHNETSETLIFLMYPNPSSNDVNLRFKKLGFNKVTITDKRGKLLFFYESIHYGMITVDISDYPADMYRVTVDNGEQKNTLCLFKN